MARQSQMAFVETEGRLTDLRVEPR